MLRWRQRMVLQKNINSHLPDRDAHDSTVGDTWLDFSPQTLHLYLSLFWASWAATAGSEKLETAKYGAANPFRFTEERLFSQASTRKCDNHASCAIGSWYVMTSFGHTHQRTPYGSYMHRMRQIYGVWKQRLKQEIIAAMIKDEPNWEHDCNMCQLPWHVSCVMTFNLEIHIASASLCLFLFAWEREKVRVFSKGNGVSAAKVWSTPEGDINIGRVYWVAQVPSGICSQRVLP